jgi:hypothetical protein
VLGVLAVIWIAIYFWWFVRLSLRAELPTISNAYGAFARSYSDLLVDNLVFIPHPTSTVWRAAKGICRRSATCCRAGGLMLALALARRPVSGRQQSRRFKRSRASPRSSSPTANFSMLYYNTGTLYDIFYLFYFSALAYYLHVR